MNKKQAILLGVLLIVSSIGYAIYRNYGVLATKRAVPQVVASSGSIASSTSGITYTSIDLYRSTAQIEGENGASYIKIQGGVPDAIKDRINTELFKRSSCFAESDEYLRGNLLHVYDFPKVDTKPPYTKTDITKMNTETLRKNLFIYGLFDELSNQEVVYVDKNLFSVEGHYHNYCGGAHPNDGIEAMNFDLQTGKEISFADLFKDFEKDKTAIKESILKSLHLTGSDDASSECGTEDLDFENMQAVLTKEGLKIESLGYPHANQACEPVGELIPYKVLLSYMNTNLPFLQEILR